MQLAADDDESDLGGLDALVNGDHNTELTSTATPELDIADTVCVYMNVGVRENESSFLLLSFGLNTTPPHPPLVAHSDAGVLCFSRLGWLQHHAMRARVD